MKDAVAGCRVVRRLQAVLSRERLPDGRLPLVIGTAGKHKMIVGNGGLPRVDAIAAGNLIERVNGERRGSVGGGQQISVHADVSPGTSVRRSLSTRCAQMICSVVVIDRASAASGNSTTGACSTDARNSRRPTAMMPPLRRISSSFGVSGSGSYVFDCVRFSSRLVLGIEQKLVTVPCIVDRLGALHDMQPEIERVAAEDVSDADAADDDHLETGFLRNPLEPGGAHLTRGANCEPVAGHHEGLPAVHPFAEVGHQIAERSGLPAVVERFQAFGNAIGRRRNLVGIDGVEFPPVFRSPAAWDPRKSVLCRGWGVLRCGQRYGPACGDLSSPDWTPVLSRADLITCICENSTASLVQRFRWCRLRLLLQAGDVDEFRPFTRLC